MNPKLSKNKLIVILIGLTLMAVQLVSAAQLPDKGNPFDALWDTVNDLYGLVEGLQTQINNIQLIPGPQGPPGEQGPPGPQGDPSPLDDLIARIEELEARVAELENPTPQPEYYPTISVPYMPVLPSGTQYVLSGTFEDLSNGIRTDITGPPFTDYETRTWFICDDNYLYFGIQVIDMDAGEYFTTKSGTQVFITFDVDHDGIMEEGTDLVILWHQGGWLNSWGGSAVPTGVITAYHDSNLEIEIWIPRSYLPDTEYRTHVRFSPDTSINYRWEVPNVDVGAPYEYYDVSTYGLIILEQ